MKKFILIAGSVYLSVGFLMAVQSFEYAMGRFTCVDTTAPNMTRGIGAHGRYRNPDPSRCTRDAFQLDKLIWIPTYIGIGPALLAAHAVHYAAMSYTSF